MLRRLGVTVGFPEGQTCCGQAVYNSGYTREARELAVRTLNEVQNSDYVVVPSGSCSAMMRVFSRDLFEDDPALLAQAESLSSRVYEFSEFLVNVLGIEEPGGEWSGSAVFHPGCHLLREMEVRELRNAETCCGFGGSFSVKMPHLSEGMLRDKVSAVRDSGADTLVSCDMSCLMHIGGALRRETPDIEIRHLAQLLDSNTPPPQPLPQITGNSL